MRRRIAGVLLLLLFGGVLYCFATLGPYSPGVYEERFPGLSFKVFLAWLAFSALVKVAMILGPRIRALNLIAMGLAMTMFFVALFFERVIVRPTSHPLEPAIAVSFFLVWLISDVVDAIWDKISGEEAETEVFT